MTRVSVLDLTAGQVEAIEQDLGIPVNRWAIEAKSVVDVYIRILAVANGEPREKYEAMSLRDLLALVSLDEDEDPNP